MSYQVISDSIAAAIRERNLYGLYWTYAISALLCGVWAAAPSVTTRVVAVVAVLFSVGMTVEYFCTSRRLANGTFGTGDHEVQMIELFERELESSK